MRLRIVAIAVLAATGFPLAASAVASDVESVIKNLDLTSFANSIGRRRIPGKTSFADHGFVLVVKTANGAKLIRKGDGRIKSFVIVSGGPRYMHICFRDRFVMAPDSISPIRADITSALVVRKTGRGAWTAEQLPGGFPNCRNTIPGR
jgi:hypothetical protein